MEGNITSDGDQSVTAYGVVWSTSSNPTTSSNDGKTTDGSGTGSFTSSVTNLDSGTKYYVRAYATNSVGTAYGTQKSFTTALELGANYQGGIIVDLDETGLHGLIVAESDQSTSATWANAVRFVMIWC